MGLFLTINFLKMQTNFDWKRQRDERDFIETIAFILSCFTILFGFIVLPILGSYIYFIYRISDWRGEINEKIFTGGNVDDPKLWAKNIRRSYLYLFFTFVWLCVTATCAAFVWMQAIEFLEKIFGY